MSDQSTFNVTVNGETVTIPLARARKLCPDEVKAMEIAWKQASVTMENQDVNGSLAASKKVEKKMYALAHALALKLQQEHQNQERG
jgi:protein involved in temperature-dependent protein secretion